jgi:T5SS/PEP-CTERM-associated repeat protein
VAEKPQAAAIGAETLHRELIVTGSAHSVGPGAIIRSCGTARAIGCAAGAARRGWGMRSYQWRSQATRAAAPAAPGAALRDSAIRIATTSAPALRSRAALLGSVWLGALAMLAPNTAHAVDGTWNGPGAEWTVGTNWTSIPPNTVPDNTATFANNGPTSVTISNSTSINTIDFTAGAPAYSFTVQNRATTFTINTGISNNPGFEPAFTVNAGAALTIGDGGFAEIGSLAGGGTVTIGPSSSSPVLSIVGPSSTTFSGTLAGAGTLELDNGTLTLTGLGSSIGGLNICNCDTNGLIISGGSLNVTDPGLGTVVEGGTLSVINGGTLQTTNLAVVISSAMLISGPGSTVTVSPIGLTEIGALVGPTSLTIANGGVLTSLGGAAIDSGSPNFTSTVTVTGAGSTWNVGTGLAVGGGGTFGGPGILTIFQWWCR